MSKVSHILRITNTIASFDTCEGIVKSVKCVEIVSLRKWLNKDGLGSGEGGGGWGQKWQKCFKYLELPLLLPLCKGQKCPDGELEEIAEWRYLGGGLKVSKYRKCPKYWKLPLL